MNSHFKDYLWEEGIPKGLIPTSPIKNEMTYKIVMDPYRKHISIEKYQGEMFLDTTYDSRLLDFRDIKRGEQLAWQKIPIEENISRSVCLIRNQDDRIVCKEIYAFTQNRCRKCEGFSPQNIPLSTQYLFYKDLGDPFNGVILVDAEHKCVLVKEYALDAETHEFSELIKEDWRPKALDDCLGITLQEHLIKF